MGDAAASGDAGILRKLLDAPWTLRDPAKAIVASVIILVVNALYVAAEIRFIARPEIAPYVNPTGLRTLLALHCALLVGWGGIGVTALYLREHERTPILIHSLVQLWAVGFVLQAWCVGAFTNLYLANIVFAGASIGLLFAEPGQVFWGFVSAIALLVGLTLAEQIGFVSYAPLLDRAPFAGQHLSTSWLVGYAGIDLFVLAVIAALVGRVSHRWRSQERVLTETSLQLQRVTDLISRYVAAQVADQIRIGNWTSIDTTDRRRLTVFFSDINGFTETAEALEPEDLARLLNEYLSLMATVAERHGGTIDKFVGDAVMIFFGAPLATNDADHAQRAVRMALEMQRAIDDLRGRWKADGFDRPFRVRMGINTGVASVGNFGSRGRVDYTAIGRQVNVAARLQAAAEPGRILVSHATWLLVRDDFECEPRGEMPLKGVRDPVPAYSVIGDASAGSKPTPA